MGLGFAGVSAVRAELQGHENGSSTFRWIHPGSDPKLWREIRSAFNEELKADEPTPDKSELDVYRYKYIEKIGIANQSALVFIGRRPQQETPKETAWDQYHTAYNFDLATREKSEIENASVMWIWKFKGMAALGPSRVPDVTFTYYSCTECEADLIFGALQFDEKTRKWAVRSWVNEKDAWWAVKQGLAVGGTGVVDGLFLYECVYKLLDSPIPGFQQDVAIRCKQVVEDEGGDVNVDDVTLRYGTRDGTFGPRVISDPGEILELTKQICPPNAEVWLCKMPAPSGVAGTKTFAIMFPQHADSPCADVESFRVLKRGMLMEDFVKSCGLPEEEIGSGLITLIYYLTDGSMVAVRPANGVGGEIESATHMQLNGKTNQLLPAKPR